MLRKSVMVLAAALLLLGAAAAVGLHYAAGALRDQVRAALGTESEVGDIRLGWSAVEVSGVRVPGPRDWPTGDTLRAERIVVTPDLKALFSTHEVRINRISVTRAYLSVLRSRDGRLRLLPSMLEKESPGEDGPLPPISIDAIELDDAAIELYDATVAKPAHKLRLEQLQARIGPVHLPQLGGRTSLDLQGVAKGVKRDGKFSVAGWMELASRDSEIDTRLRGVDLLELQPYLIKASETGVRRGSLDLDLKSTVRKNTLHAPGSLTVADLELAPGKGGMATFMGMPRDAVVGMMKDRDGRITVKFALDGRIDDPQFSLNDTFMKRVGNAMAEGLGISLESVARSVGSAAQGLGSGIGKLFGK